MNSSTNSRTDFFMWVYDRLMLSFDLFEWKNKKSKLKINVIVDISETIDLHRAICHNEGEYQNEIDVFKEKCPLWAFYLFCIPC